MVLGQQRLGVNLLSLIATLREEGRLPIRSVQWYLETVHQLRLSVGAIVSAIHRTAQRAQPADPGPHPRPARWSTPTKPAGAGANVAPPPNATRQNSRGRGVERCFLRVSDFYAAYHHYGP